MKNERVAIIILNWNGWKDTIECLESIKMIKGVGYDVFLLDNCSLNDSVKKIEEYLSKSGSFSKYFVKNKEISGKNKISKINLFISDKNYGFAVGNNVVMKWLLPSNKYKYFLLLNNDTVVNKYFLKYLLKTTGSQKNIVAVGPKIYFYNYDDRKDVIWYGGGYFNIWKYPTYFHNHYLQIDTLKDDKIVETGWISGACILIKAELFLKINGFLDERFFMGCEDVDLAIKIRKLGYKMFYNPNAKIWHKVGRSRKILLNKLISINKTNFRFIVNRYRVLSIVLLPIYIIQLIIRSFDWLYRRKKY